MLGMVSKISFFGRYDDDFKNFSKHARKRTKTRGLKRNIVETIVTDTQKQYLHLPHYKSAAKEIHLGVNWKKKTAELVVVITNNYGKIVTLFNNPVIPRLTLLQEHYPKLDLFKMLKVKRP